ncbi:MAG: HAMP domain-containing histidine kinase, partial [Candidatus Hydrogenedentes bacterium]|nr:HAMP domain-containing histidine kinase [Candidatus Hydrogenedentota bacterium]
LPYLDLGQRLHGLVLIRFLVAALIVLGSMFAAWVVEIDDLDVTALSLLALALFCCNTVTWLAIRPCRYKRDHTESVGIFLERVLHLTVAADFVGLTVALWLVGGAFSPFKAFFIFNVIIASVLLSRRAAFAHALLAYVLLAGLVIGTWQAWIPGHYPQGAVEGGELSGAFVFTVLTVQGLLILLTVLLMTYLMGVLRRSVRQLIASNQELAHLSQLRQDFLHIALHNLRSPVGAVSMHISNLANGYGGPLTEAQQEWKARSQYRLEELTRFLHDLECLTALEAGGLEQHATLVDIGEIVEELIDKNRDLVVAAGHTLTLEKEGDLPPVRGIARLIREALVNYLTNAIKYTPKGGRITVRVLRVDGAVRVEVEDSGIGVAEADQDRLFCELVRIPYDNTVLGDVAGSGLGLFIVKRIAEIHGAQIGVRSRVGEGSTFFIAFPKVVPVAAAPAKPYNGAEDLEGSADA